MDRHPDRVGVPYSGDQDGARYTSSSFQIFPSSSENVFLLCLNKPQQISVLATKEAFVSTWCKNVRIVNQKIPYLFHS